MEQVMVDQKESLVDLNKTFACSVRNNSQHLK
jgi:hypothetical protein